MINVTAAIIKNTQGEVLIARRKLGKALAGYWEFPGGKIEEGETPEESLARELKEEMNLNVQVGDFIGENTHCYEGFSIRLMAYEVVILAGDMKLTDHDAIQWVVPNKLGCYPLAPADIPLARTLY